jgi:hypothetical protein
VPPESAVQRCFYAAVVDADTLRTTATVVGVTIAILGFLYALYRDLIFSSRRRPRLDLEFDGTGADQVLVPTLGGGEAAYVRLRVTNKKGKDTADEVQVQEPRWTSG